MPVLEDRSDNRQEILKVLYGLAAAYPTANIPEETIKLYVNLLADLPIDALRAASLKHISESKWFPAISELRAGAYDLCEEGRLPLAYEAWEQVRKQLLRVGHTGKPVFTHDLILRAVEGIGGWRYLCMSVDTMADRARFVDAYDRYAGQARSDARMLPQVKLLAERLRAGSPRKELPDGSKVE